MNFVHYLEHDFILIDVHLKTNYYIQYDECLSFYIPSVKMNTSSVFRTLVFYIAAVQCTFTTQKDLQHYLPLSLEKK
jgi:hypothetical protein